MSLNVNYLHSSGLTSQNSKQTAKESEKEDREGEHLIEILLWRNRFFIGMGKI